MARCSTSSKREAVIFAEIIFTRCLPQVSGKNSVGKIFNFDVGSILARGFCRDKHDMNRCSSLKIILSGFELGLLVD